MTSAQCISQAPVPPPSSQRPMATALLLDALTLVNRLLLLKVCGAAAPLDQQHCPPPQCADAGGAPRVYHAVSQLLVTLLRSPR